MIEGEQEIEDRHLSEPEHCWLAYIVWRTIEWIEHICFEHTLCIHFVDPFFYAYTALFLFGQPPAFSALWEIIYILKVCLLSLPELPQWFYLPLREETQHYFFHYLIFFFTLHKS